MPGDKTILMLEILFLAIRRLYELARDIKSGTVDPDAVDLQQLRARVDALDDLPT